MELWCLCQALYPYAANLTGSPLASVADTSPTEVAHLARPAVLSSQDFLYGAPDLQSGQ